MRSDQSTTIMFTCDVYTMAYDRKQKWKTSTGTNSLQCRQVERHNIMMVYQYKHKERK